MLLMLLYRKGGALSTDEVAKWEAVFAKSTQRFARDDIINSLLLKHPRENIWGLKSGKEENFAKRFPSICAEFVTYWDLRKQEITRSQNDLSAKGVAKGGKDSQMARKNAFLVTEIQRALTPGGMSVQELR